MKKVSISDVTMKQAGKARDFTLTFKEKLEVSKLLDRLGVSVIELDAIENVKIDSLLVKSVAAAVKNSVVAVPVQMNRESVETTWNALKLAGHPRLQVVAPVSAVQMEYLFHKKPDAMLEAVRETVAACRDLTQDVEFVADDATRSDPAFLYQMIGAAVEAGASTVTVCDTAGAMLPDEFTAFLDGIYATVPSVEKICLGVFCSDELFMADACAIAAVRRGVCEIKAAAYGVNTVSLPNVTKVLAGKGSSFGVTCGVRTTEMKRIINQITCMCQTERGKKSPFDNGIQEFAEAHVFTCHDDASAVMKAAEKLGYDLSEEDGERVWQEFRQIAARKEQVSLKELDAIVAGAAMQVPATYRMESYVCNTGNVLTAMAHIKLCRDDKVLEGVSLGDGPIDAAFLAIEQIIGRHYELDDFQIQAVTEDREAMGQAMVKLRSNGKLYGGRGISTDIVGASIQAYISALNKIAYEEEEL